MSVTKPAAVIYNSNVLWHLAPNTTFREISSGREFVVGARPNVLWLGTTPCHIDVVEMPVEVFGRV